MKSLLFSLLFFLTFYSYAQTFSQEFQNNLTIDTRFYPVSSSLDQHFVAFDMVDLDDDFRNKVHLVSTDLYGQIEEIMVYECLDSDFSISCYQILNLSNGDQILSGTYSANNSPPYRPYIMSINAEGAVNWAKKINTNKITKVDVALLSDESLLVIFKSYDGSNHQILCKLDLEGDFSHFTELSISYFSPQQITPYEDSFEILFVDGHLMRIPNDLSAIIWQRKYHNEIGITYCRAENGDYLFAAAQVAFPGYMTVFRTDEVGNTIWAQYIEAWEGENQNQTSIFDIVGFHFIEESDDGDIIISANSEGGLNGSLHMVLNSEGEVLNNYKIESFKNKMELLDQGQYLLGGFLNFGSYTTENFIFEKRDLNQQYPCDSILNYSTEEGDPMPITPDEASLSPFSEFTFEDLEIIAGIHEMEQSIYCDMALSIGEKLTLDKQIELYPNPTEYKIWIQSHAQITLIEVYNTMGIKIGESDQKEMDMSHFPKGIYILKINTGPSYLCQKVVKK